MSAFIDARTIPSGTVLEPDLAIIGGGPAGITLALALAHSGRKILLLESGGMDFDPRIQKMYEGAQTGIVMPPLQYSRLRYLGGSTNHWGGWCRPLDKIDFEKRDWLPHSGWPITRKDLAPYYPRAQSLVEAGPWLYDQAAPVSTSAAGPLLDIGQGGIYTSWFQFSKTRDDVLPTHFGTRYERDLKALPNFSLYFHANVMGLRLSHDARRIDHLDIGTLTGKRFTVKPRYTVLAVGGMENPRLLLASNDVAAAGVGNGNDLVGRFFADTPVPRDVGTLVVFGGALAPFYGDNLTAGGTILRATFAPNDHFRRQGKLLCSLTTVENPVPLDELGRDAVVTTAIALGVDASGAKAYSLGCGMEMAPDPERRLTLTNARDALGMPRLKLDMRIADSDFAHYRRALTELGRQMLAAKTGMVRVNLETRTAWLAGNVMAWGSHHMGTTRMSDDPRTGVVDANLAVHGVPNLFIAGSSVFPTYGASNPTMNLLALTLRLADHLKKVMA